MSDTTDRELKDLAEKVAEVKAFAERIVRESVLHCQTSVVETLMSLGNEGHDTGLTSDDYFDALNELHGLDYVEDPMEMIQLAEDTGTYRDGLEGMPIYDAAVEFLTDERELDVEDWNPKYIIQTAVDDIDFDPDSSLEEMRETIREAIMDNAEVFEWWLVDDWLARNLKTENEIVITDGTCQWWGRQCTGQALRMDSVFMSIAERILTPVSWEKEE